MVGLFEIGSHCLGWPGTHYIDQAGLELEILPSVGITGMHHHIWLKWGRFHIKARCLDSLNKLEALHQPVLPVMATRW